MTLLVRVCLVVVLLGLPGCMAPKGPDGTRGIDPFEPSNRVMFAVNEGVDKVLFEPIGKGWRFITPRFVRTALDKAFLNLRFPVRFVSLFGQWRPKHAGEETLRFAVNTTVGLAGLWDPASRIGLGLYDEDIGQMLGVWGIGQGPYWVLPFFGPSGPRDTVGLGADTVLNIGMWVIPYAGGSIAIVNSRAIAVPAISSARESSLDYYVFVRDAYMKRRARQVENLAPVMDDLPSPDDDFYDGEDDFYEIEDDEDAGPGTVPEEGL